MKRDGGEVGGSLRQETRMPQPRSVEWIRTLPGDLLEPHPLVKELRDTLRAKDATLADREREIARLEVALAFGLKRLPLKPDCLNQSRGD